MIEIKDLSHYYIVPKNQDGFWARLFSFFSYGEKQISLDSLTLKLETPYRHAINAN